MELVRVRSYRGRARPLGWGTAAAGVFARTSQSSPERLERFVRLAQGGVEPATVAGPAHQLGLHVDAGPHAARALVEAAAHAAHDDDLVAGGERLDPRRRVP